MIMVLISRWLITIYWLFSLEVFEAYIMYFFSLLYSVTFLLVME